MMLQSLQNFYFRRIKLFQKKFNRVVPFGDTVVDRWDKAKILGFGKNSSVYDSALILGAVEVGDNVWIGPSVVLDGSAAPLKIGSFCSISAGVQIYTHDSVGWAVTGGKQQYSSAPVTVGSNVYIGPNVIVAAGVTIGDHVIIGAQSFVRHDIPNNTAVWGQPAKPAAKIVFSDASNFTIKYINGL